MLVYSLWHIVGTGRLSNAPIDGASIASIGLTTAPDAATAAGDALRRLKSDDDLNLAGESFASQFTHIGEGANIGITQRNFGASV